MFKCTPVVRDFYINSEHFFMFFRILPLKLRFQINDNRNKQFICTQNILNVHKTFYMYTKQFICTQNSSYVHKTFYMYTKHFICTKNSSYVHKTVHIYTRQFICTQNSSYVHKTVHMYTNSSYVHKTVHIYTKHFIYVHKTLLKGHHYSLLIMVNSSTVKALL